jgi:quinol monooxygenase YgiN
MTRIMVRHRVKDYSHWREVFDGFINTRKANGEKSYQIFQDSKNENNLYLMFEWDNENNARRFFDSTELKNAMQKGGVAETPEIHYLKEAGVGALK